VAKSPETGENTLKSMNLSTAAPVMIVGGGSLGANDFQDALIISQDVIAADGGAQAVLAEGIAPKAIIGDLDSLSAEARATFGDVLYHVPEQSTTDFEKCLQRVESPLYIALGFTGGRLDHTLAVLNVLARYCDRKIVLIDDHNVCVVVPKAGLDLALEPQTRLSLMPLGSAVVTTVGLRWDLDRANYAPDGAVSISNEVAQERQHISCEGPVLLVSPRSTFHAVIAAL